MGIKQQCVLWDDVFDTQLDEQLAPEIGSVLDGLGVSSIYTDPVEFFKRTYFTDKMIDALEKIVATLRGEGSANTYTIYSLFGGGKTHTLLTIYHAFQNPSALRHPDVLKDYDPNTAQRLNQIASDIESVKGDTKIIVVFGKSEKYSGGRPERPYTYDDGTTTRTVWGYIAYHLGKYEMVRIDDENHTNPDLNVLTRMFLGERVLILMDEIVELAHKYQQSRSDEERRYANLIPTFLEMLTKAIHGTESALVVTMPVELSRAEISKMEHWYDQTLIASFWRALKNVGDRFSPLVHSQERDDLLMVLKKRIFSQVNLDQGAVKELTAKYREFSNVFGDAPEPGLEESYPFHPTYLRVVRDLVEKANLQKTRDVLKITRIVVRQIWNGSEDPSMIMPWHIDPGDTLLRSYLFLRDLAPYGNVYDSDVIEGIDRSFSRDIKKRDLAKLVARVIFLSTYFYDTPTARPYLPTRDKIARMVYEPAFFYDRGLSPTHIVDVLNSLTSSMELTHFYSSESHYWFWRNANVMEIVKSEAKKRASNRTALEECLKDFAQKLLRGQMPKTSAPTIKKVLNVDNATVVTSVEGVEVQDTPKYSVLVVLRDDLDERTLKRLILQSRTGSRNYRNTIIVAFMSSGYLQSAYQDAAIIEACKSVSTNLMTFFPDADDALIKVQKHMISKIRDHSEERLIKTLMNGINRVAYPVRRDGRDDVKIIDVATTASNILDNIYLALRHPHHQKIMDDLGDDFDLLNNILKRCLSIDLSEGTRAYRVGEIMEWFRVNPGLPMVDDTDLIYSLKKGVDMLKIGMENERLWYKKVHESRHTMDPYRDGEPPATVKKSYRVLPWRMAIEKQVAHLMEQDGKLHGNFIHRYMVVQDSDQTPLSALVSQPPDVWRDVVKDCFILLVTEEVREPLPEIEVRLEPSSVSGKAGEIAKVKYEIVGDVPTDITVKVDRGSVSAETGALPLAGEWEMVIPEGDGTTYAYMHVYVGGREVCSKPVVISIESDVKVVDELTSDLKGAYLLEISRIEDPDLLEKAVTYGTGTITGNAKFSSREYGEIDMAFRNTEGSVALETIRILQDAVGLSGMSVTVTYTEPKVINEGTIASFKGLKARYRVKVR